MNCCMKSASLWFRSSIKSLNFAPLRESLLLIPRRNRAQNYLVSFHEPISTLPGKATQSKTFWCRCTRARGQNLQKCTGILIKNATATRAPILTHCWNHIGILITGSTDIIMHKSLCSKSTRILITDCDNMRLARHFYSESYSCLWLLPAGDEKP